MMLEALILVAMFLSSVHSWADAKQILHPSEYTTPSGRWRLKVDPSKRNGAGPGRIELLENGERVYARGLDFTPWSAVVTEDGFFFGYGFSAGRSEVGKLRIVLLDPEGMALLDETREQEPHESLFPHGLPYYPLPMAKTVVVCPELDRAWILISELQLEAPSWYEYELTTGKELRVFRGPGEHDFLGEANRRDSGSYLIRPLKDGRGSRLFGSLDVESNNITGTRPLELKLLADLSLNPRGQDSDVIRDIEEYGFSASGGIEFLRRESGPYFSFVRLQRNGEEEFSKVLRFDEDDFEDLWPGKDLEWDRGWYDWIGDQWLLTLSASSNAGGLRSFLCRLNVRSGDWELFDEINGFLVMDAAASISGDLFLLLEGSRGRQSLVAYNRKGVSLWSFDRKRPLGEYVCSMRNEFVATCSRYPARIVIFRSNGVRVRTFDLPWIFKATLYPHTFVSDGEEGLLVGGNDGMLHRMDAFGKPLGLLQVGLRWPRIKTSPTGEIWGVEGNGFFRLDERGHRVFPFGESGPPRGLDSPKWPPRVDQQGRILIMDEDAGLHVFDYAGESLFLCHLQPGEYPYNSTICPVANGTIHFRTSKGWASFDDSGTRFESPIAGLLERVSEGPNWGPVGVLESGHVWSSTREGFDMYTASGKTLRRIRRRPDGRWIAERTESTLDPDGNLIYAELIDVSLDVILMGRDGGRVVSLHSSGGVDYLRASREWCVVGREDSVVLIDRRSDRPLAYEVYGKSYGDFGSTLWDLSPDSQELWAIDIKHLTLRQYALP